MPQFLAPEVRLSSDGQSLAICVDVVSDPSDNSRPVPKTFQNPRCSHRRKASPISRNTRFRIRAARRRDTPRLPSSATRYARPPRFRPLTPIDNAPLNWPLQHGSLSVSMRVHKCSTTQAAPPAMKFGQHGPNAGLDLQRRVIRLTETFLTSMRPSKRAGSIHKIGF